MSRGTLMFVVAWMVGCESEPPDCEVQGIQTCDSQLEIRFRDGFAGDFRLLVSDEVGMDIVIECPDTTKGPDEQDGYTWFCSEESVLITTSTSYFANEVDIGVGALPPQSFEVQQTTGQDQCGNLCTIGSVEI